MKFKKEFIVRLMEEYDNDLDLRMKIVLDDLDKSYFKQFSPQREVTITDISRTPEEQITYYPEYYEQNKVPRPTFHIPYKGNTCATDIRLESFTEKEVNDLIIYLVGKWNKSFGLKCLAHNVKGYHLHIQVSQKTREEGIKIVADSLGEELVKSLTEKKSDDLSLEEIEKQLNLTPFELKGGWREIKTLEPELIKLNDVVTKTVKIKLDDKTKKDLLKALAEFLTIVAMKTKFLSFLPDWLKKFILSLIISSLVKKIISV